jgi:signal transduction histidine kinase/ligand-binding sensor domain-containing protein
VKSQFSRVALAAFFLFLTMDALAQSQFDTWTTENGLPQNSINDILQTRNGYLWLSTNGGLVRFDGARFVVFDRSTEGIKSQRVRTMLEDSKGTLWAGTDNGMLIRHRGGKFITYTVEDGLPHAQVSMIEEDDEGNLWITWHAPVTVVTKFDGERFVNYAPEDFPHGVNGHPDKRRYPWWSHDSAGLHCLVKGRVRTYSLGSDLQSAQIVRVNPDFHGNLWIQTRDKGVVKATNGQIRLNPFREGLPNNEVEGLFLEDRKDNLWFGVHEKRSLYRIKDGKHEVLSTPTVSKLYEDREGSIWIGTLEGLHRVRQSMITLYTQTEGLSWNWVYPILQDRAGAIWIGSGGLNRYEHGRFTHYGRNEGLPSSVITCIYEDHSGTLWVGTGLGVTYLKNGRFKRYDEAHGPLSGNVWAIHQDRDGNFWFATDNRLVKLKDGLFTEYTSRDGLSHDLVTALFEDSAGALWIGTHNGLTRLRDGVFTAYTERNGFIGNQVRAIYEDDDQVLWVGTYDGGLYRIRDERLTRYTRSDGLHDNGVFQILEDDEDNLWMGCNRGIYRVSRQDLNDFAEGKSRSITSFVYGTKDGLARLECNGGRQPSGLKTKDGMLWFPTMSGVAVVNPKAGQPNIHPPPVIIEEFRLGGEAIDFLSGVEINPGKDNFEISYTAPSFIKPEQVRFKYKLEGLDEDWIDAGNRRTASYYKIPAGRYRFVVIAANNDAVWNTEGKSIEIVVFPPFWLRWWFITFASIIAASIVFLFYERRVWRLRRENALQQAFSQQLIDSQENERRRIASELHDSLGQNLLVAKNIALLGLNMAENGSPTKERFDEISTMTSQALENVREITHNLRPYHLDQLGLKEALEFMLEKVSSSSRIRFVARIDRMDGLFSKEAQMNLYRIAQECTNNIIKHSEATEAKVTLKQEGQTVRLVIEDNGKGFTSKPASSNETGCRGLGLTSISERARMLGGKEEIYSNPGRGTTITVTVNLQDGHHEV